MRTFFVSTAILLFSLTAFAQENQLGWRGPKRNGIFPEKGLLQSWPAEGPKLLWSANIGNGYSSPTIEGELLYATGNDEDNKREFLMCLSRKDGKILWRTEYGNAADSYEAARSTPTIFGDKIYAISGKEEVVCFDKKSGKIVWSIDAFTKFEGDKGMWGFSESPLVFDDKIIVCPAGKKTSVVALNNQTGETIWQTESLDQKIAYHIPRLINHNGIKMIVTVFQHLMVGVDASNGKILWQVEVANPNIDEKQKKQPRIFPNTVLYKDGMVYATGGYNYGGVMAKIAPDGKSASAVWRNADLDVHMGGVVELDGVIYGSSWDGNSKGKWLGVDWNTGKNLFENEWVGYSKGAIIFADGKFYVYEERKGGVALVQPSKEKWDVISTFNISRGEGPHWAHPVVNNGVLYIRHGSELMAYAVK